MKSRISNDQRWAFFVLVAAVMAVGVAIAILSFSAGGFWKVLGIAALAGEALVIYGMFIESRRLTVARYREALHRHPETWLRVVFLSDLHARPDYPEDWWQRLATEVQALGPDVVVIGGDLVARESEPVADLAPLKDIQAPLGKYFVLGNHDFKHRPQEVRAAMRGFGFEDLTNRSVILTHEGRRLELQGMDDHWYGRPESFKRDNEHTPHVLVAHEPDVLLDLQTGDTDLLLTGHTHGGQVRLPLIGFLWVPSRTRRVACHGKCLVNGVKAIVSNGLGQSYGRPRLFTPPQILVVEVGI